MANMVVTVNEQVLSLILTGAEVAFFLIITIWLYNNTKGLVDEHWLARLANQIALGLILFWLMLMVLLTAALFVTIIYSVRG